MAAAIPVSITSRDLNVTNYKNYNPCCWACTRVPSGHAAAILRRRTAVSPRARVSSCVGLSFCRPNAYRHTSRLTDRQTAPLYIHADACANVCLMFPDLWKMGATSTTFSGNPADEDALGSTSGLRCFEGGV